MGPSKLFVHYSLQWGILLLILVLPIKGQKKDAEVIAKVPEFEIVANMANKMIRSRSIYVYLGDADFSEESVSLIFKQMDKQFCEPFDLSITVFSDRKMLEWLMNAKANIVDLDFSTPQAQMQSYKYLAKIYPPSTGYLRAEYVRNKSGEYFDISPSTDSTVMRRIVITDSDGTHNNTDNSVLPKSTCKPD